MRTTQSTMKRKFVRGGTHNAKLKISRDRCALSRCVAVLLHTQQIFPTMRWYGGGGKVESDCVYIYVHVCVLYERGGGTFARCERTEGNQLSQRSRGRLIRGRTRGQQPPIKSPRKLTARERERLLLCVARASPFSPLF